MSDSRSELNEAEYQSALASVRFAMWLSELLGREPEEEAEEAEGEESLRLIVLLPISTYGAELFQSEPNTPNQITDDELSHKIKPAFQNELESDLGCFRSRLNEQDPEEQLKVIQFLLLSVHQGEENQSDSQLQKMVQSLDGLQIFAGLSALNAALSRIVGRDVQITLKQKVDLFKLVSASLLKVEAELLVKAQIRKSLLSLIETLHGNNDKITKAIIYLKLKYDRSNQFRSPRWEKIISARKDDILGLPDLAVKRLKSTLAEQGEKVDGAKPLADRIDIDVLYLAFHGVLSELQKQYTDNENHNEEKQIPSLEEKLESSVSVINETDHHPLFQLQQIRRQEVDAVKKTQQFKEVLQLNFLTLPALQREDILDLFQMLKVRQGGYFDYIHHREETRWGKFRLFCKSNRNGQEEAHFLHTEPYQTAVKLLKKKYLELAPLRDRGREGEQRDFAAYIVGNSPVHPCRTGTAKKLYRR